MLEILNSKVYDLEESVIASGFAMKTEPISCYTKEEFVKGIERMKKLVRASRTTDVHCHDNALTGIRVSFDIVYPQYWTPEAQRYHFLDIVTSSSKMHRLLKMDLEKSCNGYVTKHTIDCLKGMIDDYNGVLNDEIDWQQGILTREGMVFCTSKQEALYELWMIVLSNCPLGLELFMRCSTNYKQLQTIYHQRRHHKMKEWHIFCEWIESLPYFKELILGE